VGGDCQADLALKRAWAVWVIGRSVRRYDASAGSRSLGQGAAVVRRLAQGRRDARSSAWLREGVLGPIDRLLVR